MSESPVRLYEGLFLMHSEAGADLLAAQAHVQEILNRSNAETLVLKKWDERKLAFPIHGQKRGVYFLAYFKAKSDQVINIERDSNLSEQVVRSLVLRADHVGEAEIELAKREESHVKVEAALRGQTDGQPAAAAAEPVAQA